MKLVIGLGNPGKKYKNNRHNVGFMVVDNLGEKLRVTRWQQSRSGKADYAWVEVGEERIELFKPQAFMNDSGFSVLYAKKKHQNLKISDIFVIHDDLDICLGEYKIQLGHGPKDHGGLNSIDKALGTSEYWHVRIGVDNRDSGNRIPGEKYVLEDFKKEEELNLESVVKKVVEELCKKLAIQ